MPRLSQRVSHGRGDLRGDLGVVPVDVTRELRQIVRVRGGWVGARGALSLEGGGSVFE
jgi:hypothetical protein